LGDADIWSYGGTLSINDIGTKGSALGFVVGMEPKLTGTSNLNLANQIVGLRTGARSDRDTSLHIEGFYKFKLSKNILITPGVIWLTAPGHDSRNDDIFIGTVRTTFTF
jgi:carbohydrate-selective porin OprB